MRDHDHCIVFVEWVAHLLASGYVMGMRIPFYDDQMFQRTEDLTRWLLPIIDNPVGFINILNGVSHDEVTKSSVCGLWDPGYFDGGYVMFAGFQYGTRDIFPFYPDDITLHSIENSRLSSFLVGENDIGGLVDEHLKKWESRKEGKRRKSKEALRPA